MQAIRRVSGAVMLMALAGCGAPEHERPWAAEDLRPAIVRVVAHSPDGMRIAGARVTVTPRAFPVSRIQHALGREPDAVPDGPALDGATDAGGVAEFGGIGSGWWTVTVVAEGTETRAWTFPGGHGGRHLLDAVLRPGADLRGRVEVGGGAPPAGTAVVARILATDLLDRTPDPHDAARTVVDADGNFRLHALPPEELRLRVEIPGSVGLDAGAFAPSGDASSCDIDIPAPLPFTIEVVGPSSEPVAEATVALEFEALEAAVTSATAADGRAVFRIPGLGTWVAPGLVDAGVRVPGMWQFPTRSLTQPAPAGAGSVLRMRLRPGGDVQGTVRTADGAPVARQAVGADSWPASHLRSEPRWTRTDTDGRFVLDGLPEGPVRLVAGANVLAECIVSRSEPCRVNLVLPRAERRTTTALTGSVRRANGTPADGATVSAWFHSGGLSHRVAWTSSAANGTFTLAAIDDAAPIRISADLRRGGSAATESRRASEFDLPLTLVLREPGGAPAH